MANVILDLHARKTTPYLRSASILKPLIVWLALKKEKATAEPIPSYLNLKTIISESDNLATSKLVEKYITLQEITDSFNQILTTHIRTEKHQLTVPDTWGQFLVNGNILYVLYKTLVTDHSPESEQVIQWMKETAAPQTFGFQHLDTAVKAGWDLYDNKLSLLLVLLEKEDVKVFLSATHDMKETDLVTWETLLNNNPVSLPEFHRKFFQRQLNLFQKITKH